MLSSTFQEIESTYGVFVHITLRLVFPSSNSSSFPSSCRNRMRNGLSCSESTTSHPSSIFPNYFIPNHDQDVVDAYALILLPVHLLTRRLHARDRCHVSDLLTSLANQLQSVHRIHLFLLSVDFTFGGVFTC